jgi:hydrocephalus-inducing protein
LKPTQEAVTEVTFKAINQNIHKYTLTLEVFDVENMNIKQEPKQIVVEAEAFNINIELKFPQPNDENLLDFGAVRVYEVKEQQFSLKNTGLYKVKYSFSMKKKVFRDSFQIEPSEAELLPGQEKAILIKFSSKTELKLRTNNSTTDIIMDILEGESNQLFKPVPINVAVNAVFSKYSIQPLKSINFGPMQFNDTKTRTFEIRNDGLFEFAYTVFDYMNEDARKAVKSAQQKMQEELQAGPPKDPKKDGKKDAGKAAPPKKDAAAAKKGEIPGLLKIGQWAIILRKFYYAF